MILFNVWAAPGSGKTTTATALYLAFKKAGYHTDLVGETARDVIYTQATCQLVDNQFLISGQQWERLKRLERYGVEVAVCDSPLMQGLLYAAHFPYFRQLKDILEVCDATYPTYDVFVHRAFPYKAAERIQTEEEAHALEPAIRDLAGKRGFWKEIKGNDDGINELIQSALQEVECVRSKENKEA